MTKMVGICGTLRHGKDSIANVLVEEYGYVKIPFADKLREVIYAINPYVFVPFRLENGKELTSDEALAVRQFVAANIEHIYTVGSVVTLHGGDFVRLRMLVDAIGWDRAKEASPDVRGLLQRTGTEAGRDIIDPDLWINLHWKEAQKHEKVVVPDVRFPPNESDYVSKTHKGFMIRVIDPRRKEEGAVMKHASELYANEIPVGVTIYNEGTLEQLRERVIVIVGPMIQSITV